jgi:hypothetical protein
MRHELAAREYKLLLDPKRFTSAPSEKTANRFWDRELKPILNACLDKRHSGAAGFDGEFGPAQKRIARFWDTADCVLTKGQYCLRERGPVDDTSRRDVTLKLRMADVFVVAATHLPGSHRNALTTLEEDVAPLETLDLHRPGAEKISLSSPRSIRSRYSLSITQSVASAKKLRKLSDAFSFFPSLKANLTASGATEVIARRALEQGPEICEFVFGGPRIRFGDGAVAKVCLTLWNFEPVGSTANVAEISFKYRIGDGVVSGDAARRALTLFVGLQEDLGAWVNLREDSKTKLALPAKCRTQAG